MSKPIKSSEFAAYAEEAKGLERDYVGEVLRSRSLWQKVAVGALGLASVAVAAVAMLTPLKTEKVVVLRVDNSTGNVEVVNTLADPKATYGEVVDKYFLNQYVLHRESYDYNTIQTDYDATALLSAPDVQREFFASYEGPESRDKVLKNSARIVVSIRSITPNPTLHTAVVRFSTQRIDRDGTLVPAQDWIATMAYAYVAAPTAEGDRRVNPLGFQVTSYRVDPETVATR